MWHRRKNTRTPLLCRCKLCTPFRSHRWIQTGVTVPKSPNCGKFIFSSSKYRSLPCIFSSNSHDHSLYHGPTNASYILTGIFNYSPGILKHFYSLLLPLCSLSHCHIHVMPSQLPKNVSLIKRRFRHLERTVFGKCLPSQHTVATSELNPTVILLHEEYKPFVTIPVNPPIKYWNTEKRHAFIIWWSYVDYVD